MYPEVAGIVLAGGRSSRMGRPKAALEWHGSTLLHRVTAIVARVVAGPVVVVRAAGQELPELPSGVELAEDAREGRGPLEGLAAGLAAVTGRARAAYVSSTDAPFLHPAFVAAVVDAAAPEKVDVALPVARGHRQPLAAAYATALLPLLEELIGADRMAPADLFERCRVRELMEADLLSDPALAGGDPGLLSLLNVNDSGEYELALKRETPEVTVHRLGNGRGDGPLTVRAATLGGAAAAAGVILDRHVVATLGAGQVVRDPREPLAAGDSVAFRSAR